MAGSILLAGCGGDGPTCPSTRPVPPAAIADLHVIQVAASAVALGWAAPDTSDAGAAFYDLRFLAGRDSPSESEWEAATRASGEPVPGPPGTPESFTVEGLVPEALYAFAIRAGGENSELAPLSNTSDARTVALVDDGWWGGFAHPEGQGLDGRVIAMLVHGERLVAGGAFQEAGGEAAANIARWDGAGWHDAGSVPLESVTSLCVFQDQLYAGGDGVFQDSARYVARWDAETWQVVLAEPTPIPGWTSE